MPNLIYLTTANGIEYAERADYRERWTEGSNEISRTVACRWSDRLDLVKDFVGTVTAQAKGLLRTMPEFHPEAPWMPCLSMDMIQPEGFMTDLAGTPVFRFASGAEGLAVYRATHANVQYRLAPDQLIVEGEWERWTSVKETYQTEAQKVPGGIWQLVGHTPDTFIQTESRIPYFTKEVRITWWKTPIWDRERIENVLNHVNTEAWPNIFHGGVLYNYAPGTLLFSGFETEEKRSAAGQLLWDVTYVMKWRQSTWNRFYYGAGNQGATYYNVVHKTTGAPPFASASFKELFSFFQV